MEAILENGGHQRPRGIQFGSQLIFILGTQNYIFIKSHAGNLKRATKVLLILGDPTGSEHEWAWKINFRQIVVTYLHIWKPKLQYGGINGYPIRSKYCLVTSAGDGPTKK